MNCRRMSGNGTRENQRLNRLTRQQITIGAWNVRTLYQVGKLELLKHELTAYHYDIVGLSETRWTGSGETEDRRFIFSGHESMHTAGVGMLMSDRARRALLGYTPISP